MTRVRKDRYLHIGVSPQVYERLKADAAKRMITVSDLIRHLVEEHLKASE